MLILLYFLVAAVSIGIGFFIGRLSKKADGMFIVNDSDYETTRWILDMKIDPKTIPDKKEIRLEVKKIMNEMIDEGVV